MNKFEMDISKQEIINSGTKITPEAKQRQSMINLGKAQGCEMEVRQIMDRTDRAMRASGNAEERQQLAIMGISELHKLLNMQGGLNINGFEILPAKGEVQEIIK